jgi:hypothetical protein
MPLSAWRRGRSVRLQLETLEDRTLPSSGIGVYNPLTGNWAMRYQASAGSVDINTFHFGDPGTSRVVGDWNGDGRDDIGTFDRSTGTWSLRYELSSGPADAGTFHFGTVGAFPVVGDFGGTGRDGIGTFDPKTGTWTLRYSASAGPADLTFQFGAIGSLPVVGDWNGDGTDGIGVFAPQNATWSLRQTASAGPADLTFRFGQRGAVPVVGDWNGDGTDGIGTFAAVSATWSLRQTASAGKANAGTFHFGRAGRGATLPVVGDFRGPLNAAKATNTLATVTLKPLDLNLLGLEVQTSPIDVTLSTTTGSGKLLGNLLQTTSGIVNLKQASTALNNVLNSTIDLLNSASLAVSGVGSGTFDTQPITDTQVLELFVAPVHLDLLGVNVDTSPIRLTITAHAGPGQVLGNVVTDLANLFNPPLPSTLDINTINSKLQQLLDELNTQIPGIAPAQSPPVTLGPNQILSLTVPSLDLNLLGLLVKTSPITVNAAAQSGNGDLLGNVLQTVLNTLQATPQGLEQLSTSLNGILAKVVGVLNASTLTISSSALGALPSLLQTLTSPGLTQAPAGSTAPILNLVINSSDGITPPVDVNLLGLQITTSNIDAQLLAQTGDGQVLGNLLYNLANLANPNGAADLLKLLNLLGTNKLNTTATVTGTSTTSTAPAPAQLLKINLKPIDLNLLGLEVKTDTITVTASTQGGDGKLLGNLIGGISTLLNVPAVSSALNNVLSSTIDLLNSAGLNVSGVGSGTFDTATAATTPVLDVFVAPVHLDLLGVLLDTSPIHLTITAHAGTGLVLGNVVTDLANLFNPPLPSTLDLDTINGKLQQLLTELNQQIPGIAPAPVPPVQLGANQILSLTVPPLDLNLLGLVLQTSPITVNAAAQAGNGELLGNVLQTALNTLGATPANLSQLSTNLNGLLAKVVGVLNAATLTLSSGAVSALPNVLQTLALPTLIAPTNGASVPVLNLVLASPNGSTAPPVDVNLLGLHVTTSNITAQLSAKTGDGQVLGNLLYNVANLLNPDAPLTTLLLLTQVGQLVL